MNVMPMHTAPAPTRPKPVICPMPPRPEQPYRAFLYATNNALIQLTGASQLLHNSQQRPFGLDVRPVVLGQAQNGLDLLREAQKAPAPRAAQDATQDAIELLSSILDVRNPFAIPTPELQRILGESIAATHTARAHATARGRVEPMPPISIDV